MRDVQPALDELENSRSMADLWLEWPASSAQSGRRCGGRKEPERLSFGARWTEGSPPTYSADDALRVIGAWAWSAREIRRGSGRHAALRHRRWESDCQRRWERCEAATRNLDSTRTAREQGGGSPQICARCSLNETRLAGARARVGPAGVPRRSVGRRLSVGPSKQWRDKIVVSRLGELGTGPSWVVATQGPRSDALGPAVERRTTASELSSRPQDAKNPVPARSST